MVERFERTWQLNALIIPFGRVVELWFRPRMFGVEHPPADKPVACVAKRPRTFLYFETVLLERAAILGLGTPTFRTTSLHRHPVPSWFRKHVESTEAPPPAPDDGAAASGFAEKVAFKVSSLIAEANVNRRSMGL